MDLGDGDLDAREPHRGDDLALAGALLGSESDALSDPIPGTRFGMIPAAFDTVAMPTASACMYGPNSAGRIVLIDA